MASMNVCPIYTDDFGEYAVPGDVAEAFAGALRRHNDGRFDQRKRVGREAAEYFAQNARTRAAICMAGGNLADWRAPTIDTWRNV